MFKNKPEYHSVVDKKFGECLLKIDTTWTREHFDFPLSFAPKINFEGYEEAFFPKSWSDSSSLEFWSYAFAWEISRKEIFAEKEIETVLNNYFNGLMNIDYSLCNINSKIRISKQTIYYGSIATKDAFFSQKPFNLNVRLEQFFNKATGKMLVLFNPTCSPYTHKFLYFNTLVLNPIS